MTSDDFGTFLTPPPPLIRCFVSEPYFIKSDLAEPPLPPSIWRHIWTAPNNKIWLSDKYKTLRLYSRHAFDFCSNIMILHNNLLTAWVVVEMDSWNYFNHSCHQLVNEGWLLFITINSSMVYLGRIRWAKLNEFPTTKNFALVV